MAYDAASFDATLAAAAGNDPALLTELRVAFVESLLQASTVDISNAKRRVSYDYFVHQLERESDAREPFAEVLSILLKARP